MGKISTLALPLYRFFLLLYAAAARLLAPFSPKVKRWVLGRQGWRQQWQHKLAEAGIGAQDEVIWMHASSLGEFEQGRPLLDHMRQTYPHARFVVTFFSPSGYEVRKQYPGAHAIGYLPFDHPKAAGEFTDLLQPKLVLWIKYEYWYYTLQAIHSRGIPLLLISGIFRPGQPFFTWYGGLHRRMLSFFSHLFVQHEAAASLVSAVVGASRVTVAGDTRFDSVCETAEHWQAFPAVEHWLAGAARVVVAGSTWPSDEEEIVHYAKANPGVKWIIAPHNLDPRDREDTLRLFQHPLTYSRLVQGDAGQAPLENVLIIDNVGMLRYLYRYAHISYVGGGFTGDGVHNVLEAAVYGTPVIHGPEYAKFAEATGLLEAGGSFVITNSLELESLLEKLWQQPALLQQAGDAAASFVQKNAGATRRVLQWIQENRLLTSSKKR